MSFKETLFKIAGLLRKYWKPIFLFILLFFIIIPTCINLAFKYDSGIIILQAEWDAADALNFYGGILAAGLGIYGVFLSIQYAQKNYRLDEKNRVKPYLALTYLRERNNSNLLKVLLESTLEKQEENLLSENTHDSEIRYRLNKVTILLQDGKVIYQSDLSESQKMLIKQSGYAVKDGKIVRQLYVSMPFQIDNVGSGAAINCRVAFYEENMPPRGIIFHTIKSGDTVYCHIFSETPKHFLDKQCFLKFLYQDILGTEYSQVYNITFTFNSEKNCIEQSICLNGEQKEKSIWNI